jgi:hypothetical protein
MGYHVNIIIGREFVSFTGDAQHNNYYASVDVCTAMLVLAH